MAGVLQKSAHFNPWSSLHRGRGRRGHDVGHRPHGRGGGRAAHPADDATSPPSRFGPGRIDFGDYERLRLYDEAFWGQADTDRRASSAPAADTIWPWRSTSATTGFALASDRLAANAYLSAHGLPTVADPGDLPLRAGLAAARPCCAPATSCAPSWNVAPGRPLVAQSVEGGAVRALFAPGGDVRADIDRLLDEVATPGGPAV